jgi:hypothetical protein
LKRYLWLHEATVANQTLASYSHPVSSSHDRRVAFSPCSPSMPWRSPDATAHFILGPAGAGSAASFVVMVAQACAPELFAYCVADGLSCFLNLLLAFTGNDD